MLERLLSQAIALSHLQIPLLQLFQNRLIIGRVYQYNDAGAILADRVLHFMKLMQQPLGIAEFGYTEADVPRLVDGTLVQARLLKLSPVEAGAEELAGLFRNSLNL